MLTCPANGFMVHGPVPPGYLDGLSCQSTGPSGAIVQMPLSQAVQEDDDDLSGGAIFGIIVAVLVAVGAAAYLGWCTSIPSDCSCAYHHESLTAIHPWIVSKRLLDAHPSWLRFGACLPGCS